MGTVIELPNSVACARCGQYHLIVHGFCPFCGHDGSIQVFTCPNCERTYTASGWRYCPACGDPLRVVSDLAMEPVEGDFVQEDPITDATVVNPAQLSPPDPQGRLTAGVRVEECDCTCHLTHVPPGYIGKWVCEHCRVVGDD